MIDRGNVISTLVILSMAKDLMSADSQSIEWVFFDVGSVLFNDDPQNFLAYRLVHERILDRHPGYTFEDMLAEREEHARNGANWILHSISKRLLPDVSARGLFKEIREHLIPTYDENHIPNDGMHEVLEQLAGKYRLGILANQPAECRHSLQRRGVLQHFEVVAISDELELHKPDVKLYEWATGQTGSAPQRAVMIGDRRDNDIAPAQQASMRTILVEWSKWTAKNWRPADPQAVAFLESCDRVPLFKSKHSHVQPDQVVGSLTEIPGALQSMGPSD